MTEELEQLLKNLRLKRILEIYEEQLRAAEKENASYSEVILRLMRAQWHARQETALEWRIRQAALPERWSLDTFPWTKQPGVSRRQIWSFAELEFIAKVENVVFIGQSGVGKTGLACGILLKALENGYRCQFVRAQDLFDEMYASLADRSTRQLVLRQARPEIISGAAILARPAVYTTLIFVYTSHIRAGRRQTTASLFPSACLIRLSWPRPSFRPFSISPPAARACHRCFHIK